MFVEGQDSPGIHQVVRRPFTVLRNTLPEPIPGGMCVIPSTSEPWPPAAFPVGYAAGGHISHPHRTASRVRRRSKPLRPRPYGPKGKSCRGLLRPSSQSPSPKESLNFSPIAFTRIRARLPPSPGERPQARRPVYPEHPRAVGPLNGYRRGDDFHPAQPAEEKYL